MQPTTHRRPFGLVVASVAIAMTLVACSSPSEPGPGVDSTDAEGAVRTITDVGGEVTIPVDPERIVALDEVAALNLLSIGVTPAAVFNSWRTTIPLAVLESEGIEIAETASFFPELEEVAALDPDLIVGSINEAYLARYPDYGSIAPTIRAAMQSGPGSESIAAAYGRYFDRVAHAEAIDAALAESAAQVAELHADEPLSLSALMAFAPESMVLHMDGDNTLTAAIEAAGFTRPVLQTESPEGGSMYGGWTAFSPETLAEQDADALVIAVAAQYPLEGITGLPLYATLSAVEGGRAVPVDGDMWAGGSSFYEYWVLEDLRSIASGEYVSGAAGDATRRWEAFLALTAH